MPTMEDTTQDGVANSVPRNALGVSGVRYVGNAIAVSKPWDIAVRIDIIVAVSVASNPDGVGNRVGKISCMWLSNRR